jgi:hypothetical protein
MFTLAVALQLSAAPAEDGGCDASDRRLQEKSDGMMRTIAKSGLLLQVMRGAATCVPEEM